jgi:macrolide transport system ATP-binding/permease protein
LLNCIYNEEIGVRIANGARVGYFRQDLQNLIDDESVLDSIKKESDLPEHMIRIVLGRLGIRRDDVHKKVEVLSGGERCKVSMAKIICGGYPIIILDEPTNYLDIYVLEALEDMLSEFDGTLLLVSHDRYFRRKVTDKELVIKNKKILSLDKPKKVMPNGQEKMLLEMEKAKLVSRMTYPQNGDNRDELETKYMEVAKRLNELM